MTMFFIMRPTIMSLMIIMALARRTFRSDRDDEHALGDPGTCSAAHTLTNTTTKTRRRRRRRKPSGADNSTTSTTTTTNNNNNNVDGTHNYTHSDVFNTLQQQERLFIGNRRQVNSCLMVRSGSSPDGRRRDPFATI